MNSNRIDKGDEVTVAIITGKTFHKMIVDSLPCDITADHWVFSSGSTLMYIKNPAVVLKEIEDV